MNEIIEMARIFADAKLAPTIHIHNVHDNRIDKYFAAAEPDGKGETREEETPDNEELPPDAGIEIIKGGKRKGASAERIRKGAKSTEKEKGHIIFIWNLEFWNRWRFQNRKPKQLSRAKRGERKAKVSNFGKKNEGKSSDSKVPNSNRICEGVRGILLIHIYLLFILI